jgi:rhodanese-related sulfurtransferase
MSVPTIDVSGLPADALLIDVREDDEWTAGHAPGATHIAMGQVVARLDELVGRDAPLYVVCRVGGRSGQVVQYLVGNGVDAVNVAGGMQAWAAAGRPMVSENGSAAQVI